jgi:hypothetical protein
MGFAVRKTRRQLAPHSAMGFTSFNPSHSTHPTRRACDPRPSGGGSQHIRLASQIGSSLARQLKRALRDLTSDRRFVEQIRASIPGEAEPASRPD